MVREEKFNVYINEREKRIIRKNAKINGYKSVSAFLRDRGLNLDISNNGLLLILLTYLKINLENYSPDRALNWVSKKSHRDFKVSAMTKFAGMPKDKYEQTLAKLEETINHAIEMKAELSELLAKRKSELDSIA